MEWWFGGQWPNLATWLWSLASPQWKERTNLERLSSDLQMYKLACAHSHIHTKRINLIKKKKQILRLHNFQLPSIHPLLWLALPPGSLDVQHLQSSFSHKRATQDPSPRDYNTARVNTRRQPTPGARPPCSGTEVVDYLQASLRALTLHLLPSLLAVWQETK